jgi:putative ABC transport system substrate-binding protein
VQRRVFLVGGVGALVTPLLGEAQPARKLWRVGDLSITPADRAVPANWASFVQGLRDSGYVEGERVVFERRSARGAPDRLLELASDLIRLKVDVIFARGPWAARAAKRATTTIPIVVVDLESDPVAEGLVKSLGRPGGNVTGLFLDLAELGGKQLELLKEIVPRLSRVGVLGDTDVNASQLRAMHAAAHILAIDVQSLPLREGKDLDGTLRTAATARVQAVVVLTSPITIARRKTIAELAAKYHLPAMYGFRVHVDVGGLISYGPNLADMFRRCGEYVAKILSGAKPEDLPVERPARFELLINGKTAKALGLTIPPSVLVRADQVIE